MAQHLNLAALVAGDTLIWYDGPRLFTAHAPDGRTYLALFVDEGDSTETYLYAPISAERLAALNAGDIPLRDIYTEADRPLWRVVFDYSDGDATTADVTEAPSPLPEDWLPVADTPLFRKAG